MRCWVAGAVVAGLLTGGSAARATAPPTYSCDGRPATVVGAPGRFLRGTPGDDVVVTNGSHQVLTGGGDDRVCVTGPAITYLVVDTGAGDDVVDARGSQEPDTIRLGPGDDRFLGGSAHDHVSGGRGRDGIATGAGDDTISLSADALGSTLDPGPGQDTLQPPVGRHVVGDWTYDDRHHDARLDGRVVARWGPGFETIDLDHASAHSLTFQGSRRPERVLLQGLDVSDPVRVRAAGGADEVDVDWLSSYDLDGGPGVDRLVAIGDDDDSQEPVITADLATGRADYYHYDGPYTTDLHSRILDVEDVSGTEMDADLTGDDGPNEFVFRHGCTVRLHGAGGDDRLVSSSYDGGCGTHEYGGPGDDVLVGGDSDDRLIGGPGHDRADGRGGSDLCRAETAVHCER